MTPGTVTGRTAREVPAGPITLPHTGMTVPSARLSLRKMRTLPTSDGEAYTAELLVDGKPAGTVENSGHGGATIWYPHDAALFGPTDMRAYVAPCRDAHGTAMDEEFVLADLFEEARAARDVARLVRRGKLPVRTFAAITSDGDEVVDTFADAYYGLPAGFGDAEMRERLAWVMWRDRPHAHAIHVWTGQGWEDLPRPAGALTPTSG